LPIFRRFFADFTANFADFYACFVPKIAKLRMWVTFDGGDNWHSSGSLPFDVSDHDPVRFYRASMVDSRSTNTSNTNSASTNSNTVAHWLLARSTDAKLYASLDGGLTWTVVASHVADANWGVPADKASSYYVLLDEDNVGAVQSSGEYVMCKLFAQTHAQRQASRGRGP
jgi:hypothetical protein